MYQAAFFDVDGTLRSFATRRVPTSAVKALELLRDKGVTIVVATGRHTTDLREIRDIFAFDAIIAMNGQYCFDRKGEIIRKCVLDRDDVAVAVEQATKRAFPCYFMAEHVKFVNFINPAIEAICALVGTDLPEVRDPASALDTDIFQLCAYLPEGEEDTLLRHMRNAVKARWHPEFFDITPKSGGKQIGIDAVMTHFGLDPEKTIAFGDGENDISMLRYAKMGVAMGNADAQVRKEADYVTDSVDEDGIYTAVRKFFS